MSKPVNKTLIGIFVITAIAVIVAAVIVFGSGKFFTRTFKAVCHFEGSVGGLSVGAPVVFKGVRIGTVSDVILRFDSKRKIFVIPVYLEIQPDKIRSEGPRPKTLGENLDMFIKNGLRASLETQSFVTGQLQVALDFYPDKPATFAEHKMDFETPEIPTVPTRLQEFARKLDKLPIEEIVLKLKTTMEGLDKLVNSPEANRLVKSIDQTTVELKNLAVNINNQVGPTAAEVRATAAKMQKLAANIDEQLRSFEDVSIPHRLDKTLNELGSAARSLRLLSDTLQQQPDALIFGKKDTGGKQ
ncbi:MAG: MlaD family protein [Syntrophorhabdaceae bacterium]